MRAYKNFITVEFKYFDLEPCLTQVVCLCSSVPLLCLVVKIEIEDGGDVAQARSQDAKANECQGETVMCDNDSIKL